MRVRDHVRVPAVFDPVRVTKAVHLLGYVDSVAKLDDKFTGPVDLGGATAKWREGFFD